MTDSPVIELLRDICGEVVKVPKDLKGFTAPVVTILQPRSHFFGILIVLCLSHLAVVIELTIVRGWGVHRLLGFK